MSKILGSAIMVLGTGGIAVSLLKDTKYDPLVKLGITKPKTESEIQKEFDCEYLFLRMYSNRASRYGDLGNRLQELVQFKATNGGLSPVAQKEFDDLQSQINELDAQYKIDFDNYNNSGCNEKYIVLDGCISGFGSLNPNCLTNDELSNGCLKRAKNYLFTLWENQQYQDDLLKLSNADFDKKYSVKNGKAYYQKVVEKNNADLPNLKKLYDSCNWQNVDCVSLKEDIDDLQSFVNTSKADPDYSRIGSPVRADSMTSERELNIKANIYTRANCSSKSNVRTGVNYNDTMHCIQLDKRLKDAKDDILFREEKKLQLGEQWTNASETILKRKKDDVLKMEQDFQNLGCALRLESQKLKDTSIMTVQQSKIAESDILKKNLNEQYAYIGIGALMLLTGMYIVLKK